jgi:hypothetical protein
MLGKVPRDHESTGCIMRFKRLLPPPGRSAWWLGGTMLFGFFLPAVGAAVLMVVGFYPIGSSLPRSMFWSEFGAFVAILCIGAVIVAPMPLYSLLAWSWRPLVLALLFVLFLIAGLLPGLIAGKYVQFGAFSLFSSRSADLIKAIADYERATGAPPRNLSALIPDYLPSVPETGMAIQADYRYEPKAGPCRASNAWHMVVHLPEFLSAYRLLYCPNHDYGWVDGSSERKMFGTWLYDLNPDVSW